MHSNQHIPEPLSENEEPKESKKVIILLLAALVFLVASATMGGILFASSAGFKPNTILQKLRSLTLSREKMLQGEPDDRINILLLGMGGEGHDGATLTDTIMLVSIRPSDKKIAILSIPRDLQVQIPGYGYRKINSVNAYAEQEQTGSGSTEAAKMISSILDQPIHYYLRLDFKAFTEIINTVGGVEVTVDQAFYDPLYPDEHFGYAPVSFEVGKQTMSGDRALIFARSRHGTGSEGSDFARARRQQKILFALKERLLSFDVLLRPTRIKSIMESLTNHLQTNMALWEGLRLANMLKNVHTDTIVSRVLDASPDGLLVERTYNGAFVLEPKGGTWDGTQALAKNLLEEQIHPAIVGTAHTTTSVILNEVKNPVITRDPSSQAPQDDKKTREPARVEIQNGTAATGLAAKTAETIEKNGYNPVSIGNASVRDVATTLVYDLTRGQKKQEFDTLVKILKALPGVGEPIHIISQGKVDFIVVLGKNAIN